MVLCFIALWDGKVTMGEDDRFTDHGVDTPFSTHRGIVATVDGQGRNVILVWLYDHRGCYALLLVDAETDKSETFLTPFPWGGDAPYASILSSANKFYSHFGSHFVEFDPSKHAFTFIRNTAPQMAMSMTEDDRGVIWSATYPQCGIVSYNPKTGDLKISDMCTRRIGLNIPVPSLLMMQAGSTSPSATPAATSLPLTPKQVKSNR